MLIRLIRRFALVTSVAVLGAPAFCQDLASPKFVVFGGAGVTDQPAGEKGSIHFGADLEEAPPVHKGVPFGFLVEGGYLGPAASLGSGSAMFSANYMGALDLRSDAGHAVKRQGIVPVPFFTAGYTRLFGTGNAVNYGGGVDLAFGRLHAVRFEVRDYHSLSGPHVHNIAVRVGFVMYIPD